MLLIDTTVAHTMLEMSPLFNEGLHEHLRCGLEGGVGQNAAELFHIREGDDGVVALYPAVDNREGIVVDADGLQLAQGFVKSVLVTDGPIENLIGVIK